MTTNDQIILGEVLKRRQSEVDPEAEANSFFEFFTAEQVLKDFDLSYDEKTRLFGRWDETSCDGGRDGCGGRIAK